MKETNFTKLTCWCMMMVFGLFGAQTSFAQCPVGQTNVTVSTTSGTFDAENGWELVDATANTVLLCESSGPGIAAPGSFSTCVVDGNSIELHTFDDFGDTWNGAMIGVSSSEDGSVNGCGAQMFELIPLFEPGDPGPAQTNPTCNVGGAPTGTSTNIFGPFVTACNTCMVICPTDPDDGDSIFEFETDPGLCAGTATIPPASQMGCSGLGVDDAPFVDFTDVVAAGNMPAGTIVPIVFNGTAPPANPADPVTLVITVEGDLDGCTFESFDLQSTGGVSLINVAGITGPAHNCLGAQYTTGQCVTTDFTFMMDFATWQTLGNTVNFVTIGTGSSVTLCGAGPPDDGVSGVASWPLPVALATHDSPFAAAPGDDASGVYPVGCTTVNFTSFTASGAPTSCSIDVCVTDTEAPAFPGCPTGDLVFDLLPGECEIVVRYDLGEPTDNCPFTQMGGTPNAPIESLDTQGGIIGVSAAYGTYLQVSNVSSEVLIVNEFCTSYSSGALPGAAGGTGDFEIYTTAIGDTYLGNECDMSAWTLNNTASNVPLGGTSFGGTPPGPTSIPTGGITLQPGESLGIHIAPIAGVGGTNYNQNPLQTTWSDGFIQHDIGNAIVSVGNSFCGGGTFGPQRSYTGFIKYVRPVGGVQIDNSGLTTGDPFPVGTTPQEYEVCDVAGNCSICAFNVIVNEFPDATEVLAANDNVQISVDQDGGCSLIGLDAFLEGGPYGCLDNYFFSRSPAYNGTSCGTTTGAMLNCANAPSDAAQGRVPFSCSDIGKTITVTIIDPNTCNMAWANVTVEDKIAPIIVCDTTIISCTEEFSAPGLVTSRTYADFQGPVDIPDNNPAGVTVDLNVQAPADATVKSLEVCLRVTHTWIEDIDVELTDPAGGTYILIQDPCAAAPLNAGTGDNMEVCFSDAHAAPFMDADCGPLNFAVQGNYQAGSALAPTTLNVGQQASGTWQLSVSDDGGGDTGTLEWATLEVQYCGTRGPVATDNCAIADVKVLAITNDRTCSTSGQILQTWTATDHAGNTATCNSVVTIQQPSFNDLMLPGDIDLDCCTSNYPNPGAEVALSGSFDTGIAPVSVPDPAAAGLNAAPAVIPFNLGVGGTIKDLNLSIEIADSDIRDLVIDIADADGNSVTLFDGRITYNSALDVVSADYLLCSNRTFQNMQITLDDQGCSIHEACVDYDPTILGSFKPLNSLNDFIAGRPANGNYSVVVRDLGFNNDGLPSDATVNAVSFDYVRLSDAMITSPTIDGRPIAANDGKCGFNYSFVDNVLDICDNSYKVVRVWTVLEWCTGRTAIHQQVIKVIDTKAPIISAPRTERSDEFDASTGTGGGGKFRSVQVPVYTPASAVGTHAACTGNYVLPAMGLCSDDDCSGIASWETRVFSADSMHLLDIIPGNGGAGNEALAISLDEGPGDDTPDAQPFQIPLPDGSGTILTDPIILDNLKEPDALYLARYIVKDGCGNTSSADVFFRMIDRVAPIAICREETQVSLTGGANDNTTICADDLDEGSYDNCSDVHFFMRKMRDANDTDPICNVDFGLGPDPALTFEIIGDCETGAGAFDLAAHCKYTKCVEFGCDDIGQDNQVFLLVVDDFVVDFVNFYLDVVFPFVDAIVDYNTIPLTILPADKCDDELDAFRTVPAFFWQADNDRRNAGIDNFEFYLNEDPNGDDLFIVRTAILWEGHYNFCMVDVLVEDKNRPTCTPPADMFLTCGEVPDNLDFDDEAAMNDAFGAPTAVDNCGAVAELIDVDNDLNVCGVGSLTRRWRVVDDFGNASPTCSQTITISGALDYCITFPEDFEGDCDNTNAPDDLTFEENGCDLIAVSKSVEDFPAALNGECRKEIVTWKVINWCEYDGISDPTRVERDGDNDGDIDWGQYCSTGSELIGQRRPNPDAFRISYTSTGYYEYKQHVKIFDNVAPEVSYDGPVKFCGGDLDEATCTGQVDIDPVINDLCTEQVTYTWTIKGFTSNFDDPNAPIVDSDNSRVDNDPISDRYPLGTHTARFEISDDCGNVSRLDITFTVVDCKAPTPVCHNGLSIDVMPLSGMVELWASDFDASSFDYCNDFEFRINIIEDTNGDGIITEDDHRTTLPNDDFILLDCDDVQAGLTMVQLWVSEQDGTADDPCADNVDDDYCVTFVEVQDNNGVCNGSKVTLGGKVANENSETVENVSIDVNDNANVMGSHVTDATGEYQFLLPVNGDYTVTPMRNDDVTNGVSTFDLVLISKHILNVQLLNSAYKVIAADANNSGSVSTLDLVAIRKVVLRVADEFPNNTSWRFVDKSHVFANANNPWAVSFPEVINRNNLTANDFAADFVAIKVGDVNGDAAPNSILGVEDRTFNGNLVFNASEQNVQIGDEFTVDFTAAQNVEGYQFTLDYDEKAVELIDIVDGLAKEVANFNVIADKGLVATSWNEDQATAGATMFSLVFRAKADVDVSNVVSVSSEVTTAEAYNINGDLMGISLEFNGQAQTAAFSLEQNTPNPFKAETTIGFTLPEASSATITISDVTGKVVKVVKGDYAKGYNTVTLKRSDIRVSNGVLSYQLETATHSATKQMIIIE